ncbi:methionyl-tRNA synthetase family protein, putative [Ichthyophthirius multifiliis]|uniref:Methionyl-tRNA synthetase family protein, putative n=1 Tax=Ichthyophthirius multifiliis TaxID=5932 RepID=G0QJJ8_ICHMU|nr:methionyl-tRNA synthetase family protein, putative [Ichthyophthirius multifiliis]EGR34599.1 methionyl-tRNA synthetase family protein, putative [Ichthyophthirius multifiliis]|eukprot:XP_004039903.1 methionyl-tRNA synthetase family protein, putative [Ichthyophthirius multifiliis]
MLESIQSNGMVLCASNQEGTKVELLRPNENSNVGERIFLENNEQGFSQEFQQILNPKKKVLESVLEGLKTNQNLEANYYGIIYIKVEILNI